MRKAPRDAGTLPSPATRGADVQGLPGARQRIRVIEHASKFQAQSAPNFPVRPRESGDPEQNRTASINHPGPPLSRGRTETVNAPRKPPPERTHHDETQPQSRQVHLCPPPSANASIASMTACSTSSTASWRSSRRRRRPQPPPRSRAGRSPTRSSSSASARAAPAAEAAAAAASRGTACKSPCRCCRRRRSRG